MKAAFEKFSAKGAFKPRWPYGTDLYGRLLYLEQNGTQVLICVFDFLGTYPSDTVFFRKEVSKKTGIPENHIWYHELQIHAAPSEDDLHGEGIKLLIDRTSEAAIRMIRNARECEISVTEADFGTECTFCREQYVEGLGGVTIWSGMSFDEQNKPYSQDPSIMLLRGYVPDLPVFDRPIYFDNPNDPKAYLFVFRDTDGNVIGSVSRFAAHPDVAVLFELRQNLSDEEVLRQYQYCYDWPGYLSESFEKEFGGTSIYMNGPCGDLSTKKHWDGMDTYEKSAAECQRLAAWFKEKFMQAYQEDHHVIDTSKLLKAETFAIELPVKEDLPHSRKELEEMPERQRCIREEKEKEIAAHGNPAKIKKLIDDEWRTGHFQHICLGPDKFSDEVLAKRQMTVYVTALQFGEYLFVGVPGESLVEMSIWLRSEFTGVKTIPIDQVDGYYNYMATPRSMTLGGYTYWSSWVRRDAIPILKEKMYPLLKDFIK